MRVNQRVENILAASAKARNSDKELLIIYMQKSGMELTEKQIEVFRNMPSADTITRVRRHLRESGKYLPTVEIDKHRFDRYRGFRNDREYALL